MKKFRIAAVIAVVCLIFAFGTYTPDADAHWGCYPAVTCAPAYTACYTGCYPGSWYVGIRPGPIRRLLFGPYRYYSAYPYCGIGSCYRPYLGCRYYCNPCGSYCAASACDACGGTTTVVTEENVNSTPASVPTEAPTLAPAAPAPAAPAPAPMAPTSAPAPTPTTSLKPALEVPAAPQPVAAEEATISLTVPADAKVYINNYLTTSTGTDREFVSKGLIVGNDYRYDIRVVVTRDGKEYAVTRSVVQRAGGLTQLAINVPATPETQLAQK